jgi:copper resistance protein B
MKRIISVLDQLSGVVLVVTAALFGIVQIATTGLALGQVKFANEMVTRFVVFDLVEVAPNLNGAPVKWDLYGSVGRQYNRLWIKSDGNISTGQSDGDLEFQALFSRLISPYWDAQAGIRLDRSYSGTTTQTRALLAVGLNGLAPYWFELEPALFVSQDGDVSATVTGSYDLLVTQRLVLQPRLDLSAAVQDVPEWGVGSGLGRIGLGLRARYELRREFAPYVGLSWTRLLGDTATLAREQGAEASELGVVLGVRMWH